MRTPREGTVAAERTLECLGVGPDGGDDVERPGEEARRALLRGFARLVLSWCDDVEAEIDTWPGTATAVGLTPGTRRMLEDTLAYYRSTLDQYAETEATT